MRAFLLSLTLLLACIALPARAQQALPGLTEGVEYRTIADGQPYRQLPPGMVEVAEVFAYWCPHCAHFAPMLDKWKQELPPSARLVLVPGVFNREDPYARVFFAAETAKALPVLHPRLFAAIHETGELSRQSTLAQVQGFARKVQGVDAVAFDKAMADETAMIAKLKYAYEFAARSGIEGTPSLIVNGRYLVLGNSYEGLLANARKIVDALAPKRVPAQPKPQTRPAAKPAAKPRA